MKTIANRNRRELIFVLLVAGVTGILPCRIVAQDKAEAMAKRIAQLENENAELRAELQKLNPAALPRYEIPLPPPTIPTMADRPIPTTSEMIPEQLALLSEINRLRSLHPPEVPYPPGSIPPRPPRELLEQANALREAQNPRPSPPQASKYRELHLEESALAQKYYDYVAKQFESGRSALEELSRARRQLFALKREGAGFDGNRAKLKEIVQEEMDLVSRLLQDAKKRIKVGTAAPGHESDLEREVLKLKRELLLLE